MGDGVSKSIAPVQPPAVLPATAGSRGYVMKKPLENNEGCAARLASGGAEECVAEDGVGMFAGIALDRVAHEIRTPLAAIQSMAEALSGGHLGSMENRRHLAYVQSIAETARHALAVVEAMLQRSGAERNAAVHVTERIDLAAVGREVASGMAMLAARSGVRLDVSRCQIETPALARATDVRQMLINLISNGITHAGGGAKMSIATGHAMDGGAWIEVVDDGAGIPPDVLARLDSGTPLDGNLEGASPNRVRLGLALTRALASSSGGRLEISSGSNGTTARVVLPGA